MLSRFWVTGHLVGDSATLHTNNVTLDKQLNDSENSFFLSVKLYHEFLLFYHMRTFQRSMEVMPLVLSHLQSTQAT